MKLLNGAELAEFIKERQAKQVRALRQADKIYPKLVIIDCTGSPVIAKYVALKQRYAEDILIDVDYCVIEQSEAKKLIKKLNNDPAVHGIIVQIPLPDASQTDEIINEIIAQKDVDALKVDSPYDGATPLAINWLLTGYNIDLRGKNIVIVGQGRLVGAPLKKMLENSGLTPMIVDEDTKNPAKVFADANIIITAVGKAGLITSDMIPLDCVVVDAGLTSEKGVLKGDLAEDVYERQDLTLTPTIGGVGPLTVAALFDNVIRAAGINN
jgi:methylenetetrahydrofolate dehydrogenase (NADP+)/methenyltetrahydrofolate cyclohydrolase